MYNIDQTIDKVFKAIKDKPYYKLRRAQLTHEGVLVAPYALTADFLKSLGFSDAKLRNGVVTFTGVEGLPVIALERPTLINLSPSDVLFFEEKTLPKKGFSNLAIAQVQGIERIVRVIYKNVTGEELPPFNERSFNFDRAVTASDLNGVEDISYSIPHYNILDINAALDYLRSHGVGIDISSRDIVKKASHNFKQWSKINEGPLSEIDRLKLKFKKLGIDIE